MVSEHQIKTTHEKLTPKAQETVVYGLQVSPKTLLGNLNRRGMFWYPRGPERLSKLTEYGANIGRVAVHINFDSRLQEHVSAMTDLVLRCIEPTAAPKNLLVQLNNLDWLAYDWSWLIHKIRECGHETILQASMPVCSSDPIKIARAVSVQMPDYVLLDSSGGNGTPFSAAQYAQIIEALKARSDTPIAIAGGMGPGNLHNLSWLAERFDGLSCCAETKLRDNYTTERPDMSRYSPLKAAQYIVEANDILL